MTSPATVLFLAGAGVLAGTFGSAGAITSLVSYPALLAAGLGPFTANVTNSVAVVASFPGSVLGSRPELAGRGRWLGRWAGVPAAGGTLGMVLLLCTPRGAFARVVPFLLLTASLVLVLQPYLAQRSRGRRAPRWAFVVGLFALSTYDGYFGAGAGVMLLAVLLLTVETRLARANALKNALLGVADVLSGLGFVLFGPVHWLDALPLALGLLVGSSLGPSVTRRVPPGAVRAVAALAGTGLAVRLWLAPA